MSLSCSAMPSPGSSAFCCPTSSAPDELSRPCSTSTLLACSAAAREIGDVCRAGVWLTVGSSFCSFSSTLGKAANLRRFCPSSPSPCGCCCRSRCSGTVVVRAGLHVPAHGPDFGHFSDVACVEPIACVHYKLNRLRASALGR